MKAYVREGIVESSADELGAHIITDIEINPQQVYGMHAQIQETYGNRNRKRTKHQQLGTKLAFPLTIYRRHDNV